MTEKGPEKNLTPPDCKQNNQVSCEVCGKSENASQISWEEDANILMCRLCRAEEESCGCSDD